MPGVNGSQDRTFYRVRKKFEIEFGMKRTEQRMELTSWSLPCRNSVYRSN